MPDAAKTPADEAIFDIDVATDEAIAVCDGDARAAVKALLVMNGALERELELAASQVQPDLTRRRCSRPGICSIGTGFPIRYP